MLSFKQRWKASYRDSLEKYLIEKKIYDGTAGVTDPALHEEEPSDEAEAGALDSDASSDSEDESAAIAPTPTKVLTPPVANTKTPRPTKRQKTAPTPQVNGMANGAASTVPVPIAPATNHTVVPFPVIPPPKTQILPPGSSAEVPAPTPAKEKKDKKKKAVPQPIAPAPAKEPSPDDPKKKAKGSRSTRNTEVEGEAPATPAAAVVEKTELKGTAKKRDRSKRKSEGVPA
jgi:hypothetical protein